MLADEGIHFTDIANYVVVALVPAVGWLLKLILGLSKDVVRLKAEMDMVMKDCVKLFERKADK